MKTIRSLLGLSLVFMLISTSCQTNQSPNKEELASLDLLRGEITLCGNNEFGEVSFALSCDVSVRESFDLAISLLHSFEYNEAEKAFVKVIDADPECAMAYWGIAMSNFHLLWLQSGTDYLKKGSKVLEVASQIKTNEREKAYLDAISSFYSNWENADHKARLNLFVSKMEDIYNTYPDDKEAAIFYALTLRAAADPADKTYKNQIESGKILESLFPNQPNHPGIAHYIIHNYDYPELAERALPTARRYAEIAPASAHAQHMPSHIFTRLGLWDESISSNENSAESAACYAESIDPNAHWNQELHAIDYLVYAYLQKANNEKAQEQVDYLYTIKKVFPIEGVNGYALAAIPARIALENRDWQAAANLKVPEIEFPWDKFPWQKSMIHFTRALGSSNMGDLKAAESEVQALQSLYQQLEERKDIYQGNQVLIQYKAAHAWLELAKGNNEIALTLMKESADLEDKTEKHPVTPGEVLPAKELLGDMYLAIGKSEEALTAYEESMKRSPNRFNGLYGAAVAARKSGDNTKAEEYFSSLIQLTKSSTTDRKELQEANEFLAGV